MVFKNNLLLFIVDWSYFQFDLFITSLMLRALYTQLFIAYYTHTHNEISANYNNTVMSRPVHPLLIKIKASKVRKRRSSSLNYFAFWDVRPFFYNSKWISCEKRNRGEVQTFNVPSTVRICVVFFSHLPFTAFWQTWK